MRAHAHATQRTYMGYTYTPTCGTDLVYEGTRARSLPPVWEVPDIYIYIHIYVQTHTHTCIDIYISIYIHIYTHILIYKYNGICIYIHL